MYAEISLGLTPFSIAAKRLRGTIGKRRGRNFDLGLCIGRT
jgi:hypothetical protein